MLIIQPYAKLHAINGSEPTRLSGLMALKYIEWCGRISHRSEESQTQDSWERFIQAVVMGHGDWSIVEHANATVDATVDRGVTHEWVRHRLFSFTQESTRFVNYEKKMPPAFVQPPLEGISDQPEHEAYPGGPLDCAQDAWEHAVAQCEKSYQTMIRCGAKPQIARSVFPNALASRIITTGNLRQWRHFFLMRTSAEAHPQMRQVTIPLLAEFKAKIPLLYDDIEPLARQVDNLRKPR